MTEATACFGGIAMHMHVVWHQMPFENLAFLLSR